MDYSYLNPVTTAQPPLVGEVVIKMVIFPEEIRKIPAGATRITAIEGTLWISNGAQDTLLRCGETMTLIQGRHLYVTGSPDRALAVQLHFANY